MSKVFALVATAALALCTCVDAMAAGSGVDELHVLASNAGRPAIVELVPMFEQATGIHVRVEYANNPILKQQVETGAEFDVVLIEPQMLAELAKVGHVQTESVVALAMIGMALVSRTGTPPVDIATVEAFKRVLLSADSIAYTADGHSGEVFLQTLDRLGIREAMTPRLVPVTGRLSTLTVAEGGAQYTAFPLAGDVPGVQSAGAFPEEMQTYIGISAAISAKVTTQEAARAWLAYLQSDAARALFAAKGYRLPSAR
jgi:molybdate transport system substrate-binding protein